MIVTRFHLPLTVPARLAGPHRMVVSAALDVSSSSSSGSAWSNMQAQLSPVRPRHQHTSAEDARATALEARALRAYGRGLSQGRAAHLPAHHACDGRGAPRPHDLVDVDRALRLQRTAHTRVGGMKASTARQLGMAGNSGWRNKPTCANIGQGEAYTTACTQSARRLSSSLPANAVGVTGA